MIAVRGKKDDMREWVRLAVSAFVVRQALFYAVVVGSILAAINHGEAILRGDIDIDRVLKIALSCLVPYAVSTLSSVNALRASEPSNAEAEAPASTSGSGDGNL